ncbi:MAG: Response regulator [Berkelbacteria bacterium GW2011_GWA1_39_10]|uniref:Response regulator n=1 Tax=Berkelbacteria bacterium GW2011_GWA1_39_10 TaxID=1618332 RepID=A0A0G0LFF5_9BACT|nr:MAG: Response regulator [Berkelbacteria bacterium GW2011_GWA1_39_10]
MPKILIIEDDEILSKMYAKKFTSDGYQVVVAYSGGEGILTAKKEKPNCILLDIMMPVVDGFQVIRELKKDPDVKNIPIIILTNLGTSEIFIGEAKRLGVKDYLIKYKTSAKDVVTAVKKALNEK